MLSGILVAFRYFGAFWYLYAPLVPGFIGPVLFLPPTNRSIEGRFGQTAISDAAETVKNDFEKENRVSVAAVLFYYG